MAGCGNRGLCLSLLYSGLLYLPVAVLLEAVAVDEELLAANAAVQPVSAVETTGVAALKTRCAHRLWPRKI
jgi:hypothetical protein